MILMKKNQVVVLAEGLVKKVDPKAENLAKVLKAEVLKAENPVENLVEANPVEALKVENLAENQENKKWNKMFLFFDKFLHFYKFIYIYIYKRHIII
jgi:hypothetical protein